VIVVDTSAISAIAFDEPERREFVELISAAGTAFISEATGIEARIVIHARRGSAGIVLLDSLIGRAPFEIAPTNELEARIAYEAFIIYGKGNGHPAQLNFGDLFSYAVAKARGLPLLFKGSDFSQTDIVDARLNGPASFRQEDSVLK